MTEFKKKKGTNSTPKETARPVSAQFDRSDTFLTFQKALENIKLYNNDFPDSFGKEFKQMRIGAFVKKADIKGGLENNLKDKENGTLMNRVNFKKVNKQLKKSKEGEYLLLNLEGTAKQQTGKGAIKGEQTKNGIKVIPQQGGFRNVISNPEDYYYIHNETFAQNTIKPENANIFITLLRAAFNNKDFTPYKNGIGPLLQTIEDNLQKEETKETAVKVLTSLFYHLAYNGYAVISFHKDDIDFIVEKLKNNDNSKAVVIKLVNESGGEIIQTFEERLTKVEDEQKKQEGDIKELTGKIENLQKVINNYETRIENLKNGLNGRDGRDGENGLNEEINKLIERIENLEKLDPEEIKKAIKEFLIEIFNNEPENEEDKKLQKDIIGFILRFIEENGGKIADRDNITKIINNFIDNLDGGQAKELAEILKEYLVNINLNNDNNFNFNKELWEEHKKNNEHLRQKNDQLLKLLLEKQQKPKIINNYSNTSPSEQPNQEEDNEPGIREQNNYYYNGMPTVPKPASGQSHEVTNTTDPYTTNAKKKCLYPDYSHVAKKFVSCCKHWYDCACHAHTCNYHQQKLNQLEKNYEAIIRQSMILIEQLELERQKTGQEGKPYYYKETEGNISWIEKEAQRLSNPLTQEATRSC